MSHAARRTLYMYLEFYISDKNKNTIISNSRRRMFPKFTYIAYNFNALSNRIAIRFQTGFKLESIQNSRILHTI